MKYFFVVAGYLFAFELCAQDTTALKAALLGRWEVLECSEQGIQVNKKQDAKSQASEVYQHIKEQRAILYYGFNEASGERRTRNFERWQERDSTQEVDRVIQAIAMPYYAVFFADSTLAVYNKDSLSNIIQFPESRRYIFSPGTMSIDITLPGGYGIQWQAQVLELTADRLILFLPEEAEVVVLAKRNFSLP
ncbi:MAG: hypothetical protein IPJ74_01740 [Saprospiraceae bacterium]|nr:hypothetical protein [Saprospiraceae bacterium]